MTLKQKAAVKKITENHGNVSRAMLDVGYSPNTAKKPSNLTNSKGFKELLEEYFPDTDLFKVGVEGLHATKLATSFTEADQFIPDYPTRHRYYETALKLKRYLGPETLIQNNVGGDMSLELIGGHAGSLT